MKDKNTAMIIKKLESFSDFIVKAIYNESLVKRIEELGFMKSLINSGFINSIQNFGKGWFKGFFVFLGWVTIILGPIGIIMGVIALFKYFSIAIIFSIITSFFAIPCGLGIIKFKKWLPFMTILSFALGIISSIVNNYYSYGPFEGFNFSGAIVGIILNIALFIIIFALVIKNKELFKN